MAFARPSVISERMISKASSYKMFREVGFKGVWHLDELGPVGNENTSGRSISAGGVHLRHGLKTVFKG